MAPTLTLLSLLLGIAAAAAAAAHTPTAHDPKRNITYHGVASPNGLVDKFLNIPYGRDTAGRARFAPPQPFSLPAGSVHDASAAGPACPQPVAAGFAYMSDATVQSEDCLRLKVARPRGAGPAARLPVMVFVHGGGLFNGNINEVTNEPDGLVYESVWNGLPVVYVAMNYRLNIFGFALSEALRADDSLNVGLRDQRLALEWVQENIEYFGGDPDHVTIFGQSSGGLSVALQILAYGGTRPVPFHAAIMQSTALEPTSTSNLTLDAYNTVANLTNCTSPSNPDPQSLTTLSCLRSLPFEVLMNATITGHDAMLTSTDGDIYLPTVDGTFLPLSSSELTLRGMFPRMPIMVGWTEDDATLFTPQTITTAADTVTFLSSYWPAMSNNTITTLLSLYPTSDFTSRAAANNRSAEFYRSAQIFRDILLVCPSFLFSQAMAEKWSNNSCIPTTNTTTTYPSQVPLSSHNPSPKPPVFLYAQNQTILDELYLSSLGLPGLGIIHTSDLPYVFANFTPYTDGTDWAIAPTRGDVGLRIAQAGSWLSFASTGAPSGADGKAALPGWEGAYGAGKGLGDARVFVVMSQVATGSIALRGSSEVRLQS
ncbi:Carboxylesterase type B [Neofusicoccum parvum]|uniref:Carboxylesterase type B n=1 Tax=Neofusicoccum parvum TaxID=310453 RepID=A0ACB5S0H1_9PEZI|nr:Carboxylesterase type B [Neofusicoccum parvum]